LNAKFFFDVVFKCGLLIRVKLLEIKKLTRDLLNFKCKLLINNFLLLDLEIEVVEFCFLDGNVAIVFIIVVIVTTEILVDFIEVGQRILEGLLLEGNRADKLLPLFRLDAIFSEDGEFIMKSLGGGVGSLLCYLINGVKLHYYI
jgi:hypothetical protein